jgi:hypothetical protein
LRINNEETNHAVKLAADKGLRALFLGAAECGHEDTLPELVIR